MYTKYFLDVLLTKNDINKTHNIMMHVLFYKYANHLYFEWVL